MDIMAASEVFTIGYEGRSIEDFVAALRSREIDTVIDTRWNGFSFKRDFRRPALQEHMRQQGIRFVAMPELGSPKELREELKRTGDYPRFFRKYRQRLKEIEGMKLLASQLRGRAAIMCFERDHRYCHRKELAKKLEGVPIVHL